jgi:hypothetical protein
LPRALVTPIREKREPSLHIVLKCAMIIRMVSVSMRCQAMNDVEIRGGFHRKMLRRHHAREDTLVVNELGLNHGECRADIAVVNASLVGYEIKSDCDSLERLAEQVRLYNSVFDRVFIIVGGRYAESIQRHVPEWWGLIVSSRGPRGAINFRVLRKAARNKLVDPISLAGLLWRGEAAEILRWRGLPPKLLRQPRAVLYERLASTLTIHELRRVVRERLRNRRYWRCPE